MRDEIVKISPSVRSGILIAFESAVKKVQFRAVSAGMGRERLENAHFAGI